MVNKVPHLLLDTLGDKLFWHAIFRAGVDAIAVLPLAIAVVIREIFREIAAARRR